MEPSTGATTRAAASLQLRRQANQPQTGSGADGRGSVQSQVNTLYDPWGRSLWRAVRRLWVLPLLLAILGAGAGAWAGDAAQPSAEALVRVDTVADDSEAMSRAVQTVVQELDTAPVFAAAAEQTGGTGTELRQRTQIAPATDSQVLTITVTAPSIEQAVKETDAIVAVAIDQGNDQRNRELAQITQETRELIAESKLTDRDAERARVASLGDALAASQANLLANSRQLSVLSPAAQSGVTPSPVLLAALGVVGGTMAGLALALFAGARRGRVKSARELRRLYPHLPVLEQQDLGSLVSMESATTSTWVVGGFEQTIDDLHPVIEQLSQHLGASNLRVEHTQTLSVLRERKGSRRATSDEVSVVATTVNQAVIRGVERDPEAALLLVIQLEQTRNEWLDQFAAACGDHTYLLVADTPPNWKW